MGTIINGIVHTKWKSFIVIVIQKWCSCTCSVWVFFFIFKNHFYGSLSNLLLKMKEKKCSRGQSEFHWISNSIRIDILHWKTTNHNISTTMCQENQTWWNNNKKRWIFEAATTTTIPPATNSKSSRRRRRNKTIKCML